MNFIKKNQIIQKKWLSWAWWFIGASTLIILAAGSNSGGGLMTLGGRPEITNLLLAILSASTIVHTLYHRFYLKTGVSS